MIKFDRVSKVFDSDIFKKNFTALENVSFEVGEQQVIGFLGANGAGKTTSLKIAMDFIRPTSGSVSFEKLGSNRAEIYSHIGYLPERPYFYQNLTGREFCTYAASLCGISNNVIKSQIDKWAPLFKIDFALDRKVNKYSKGMLQRLGFLSTIIHDPKLIILDEPLSGVDPIGRKDLKDLIKQINYEGKTIFFSSHIVSDLEEVCGKVIFLKNGKVEYEGKVEKIINENIRPTSVVTYYADNILNTTEVTDDKKQDFLRELINKNHKIINVHQNKPTLEEIFYKTKG